MENKKRKMGAAQSSSPTELTKFSRAQANRFASYKHNNTMLQAGHNNDGEDVEFCFIWLRPSPRQHETHVFPEDSHGVSIVDNLKAYTKLFPRAQLSVYYDSRFVTSGQLEASKRDLPSSVTLRDVGEVEAFTHSLKSVTPRLGGEAHLLFRVDFLKLILQRETLRHGEYNDVRCIVDMDIRPSVFSTAFNKYNMDRLRKFGVMWAWKELCDGEFENGVSFATSEASMDTKYANIAKETLGIAIYLSLKRLEHCVSRSALGGAVYWSLVNAVTWMVGQHYMPGEVRYVTPKVGTEFAGHPAEPSRFPLPIESVLYNPFLEGAKPSEAELSPLIVTIDHEDGEFQDTINSWFIVTGHTILGVEQHGDTEYELRGNKIMQLRRYYEMPSHLLPIIYVIIGSTLGAENWNAAEK